MSKSLKSDAAIKRRDEDAIRRLARDVITGKAYLTIKTEEVGYSFGGFLTIALPQMSKEYVDSIGAVWEFLSEAGPMAMNGRPMFLSARFVNKEDVALVVAEVRRLTEVMEL